MDAAEDDAAAAASVIKTSFLDMFGKLTLDKENLRLKGGVALVRRLTKNPIDGGGGEKELKYALARLIRGLGADSHELKRRYFSVLVALLKSAPQIGARDVLEIAERELALSASNSKSENAQAAFGQILTCGALIRAGRTDGDKKRLVEVILSAGKQRSYLYLAALAFVLELCDEGVSEDEFDEVIWPSLEPELPKTREDRTADVLHLLLSLSRKYPRCKRHRLSVINEEALPALANTLMNDPGTSAHPVYQTVAEEIARTPLAVPFVNELDSHLHSFNYNRLSAFTRILRGLVASSSGDLPKLLTPNFVSHSLRHLKTERRKDDVLREGLCELFDSIAGAQLDTPTRLGVLEHFLFHPMVTAIDRTARGLIAGLDEDGVKSLGDACRGVLLGEDRTRTNNNKVYASKLLAKLLAHPRMQKERRWKTEQLKFLMEMALLKVHVGTELSGLLRATFFQALDLKLPGLEELRAVLSELVHHLESFLETSPDRFRRPLNPVALEAWRGTARLIRKLEGKNKIKRVTLVFLVLFQHMSLQLFNEVKLACDSLGELASCHERIKSDEGGDVRWIEVVLDLFLSLLSRDSHLLRGLVRTVFPYLCKYVNATAFHQVLFVLDPAKEDNPLSEEGSRDEESDSEQEDEDESVNERLRTALQAALNTPGSDDDESLDLDEMSEGEGERLDEALAVAFKQFKPNRGKNTRRERKDKEVLTHFRLRVLDLLEVYLEASPAMLLCLEAMPPLLRLLRFCAGDLPHQEPLASKTRATLRKLCAVKKFGFVEDVDAANLCGLLRNLLEDDEEDANESVAECCAFVVRCAQHGADGELNEVMAEAATNQSALSFLFLKKILRSTWPGSMGIVKLLVEQCFDDRIRMFRRVRVLELLRAFYSNRRALLENADAFGTDLEDCEREFVEKSASFLADSGRATQAYVCSLFAVLAEIRRNSTGGAGAQWEALVERLRLSRAGSKDARNALRALCKRLGVKLKRAVEAKKRKLAEGDGVEGAGEKKRPRTTRAPNAKQKKIRKEKRALRMSAMSEGLGAVNFSDAQVKGVIDGGE